MAKKSSAKLEALGWKLWAVTFVILCIPLIYLCFRIVRTVEPWFVPLSLGMIGAGFSAAIVTWAANSTLQAINSRRAAASKHKRRK